MLFSAIYTFFFQHSNLIFLIHCIFKMFLKFRYIVSEFSFHHLKMLAWNIRSKYSTGNQKTWGLSHTNQEKSDQSYTFCCKKGANHIPGSAEKGGHLARTSVLCHI